MYTNKLADWQDLLEKSRSSRVDLLEIIRDGVRIQAIQRKLGEAVSQSKKNIYFFWRKINIVKNTEWKLNCDQNTSHCFSLAVPRAASQPTKRFKLNVQANSRRLIKNIIQN